ncbi:MAG TPA: tRNA pseudouridine(55) synthase TruB, partial [Candidatus Limnocylindrales bacterium]
AGSGLDGILVLAKPPGPTSHDMVSLVRRISATRRVGHGGTLDPFASGVLPLFLGRATRVVEYHLGDEKAYRATVCFGAASTTDDLEGELTPFPGPAPDRATVEATLGAFRGSIEQTPPAYSAIKVAGRRAYAVARAGGTVELRPRTVTIGRLDLVDWDGSDPERPVATVEVECSAGTYIRAIARDLGAALGNAAYLGALVRTASGPFRLETAVSLDALRQAADGDSADDDPAALAGLLLPVDAGLEALASVTLVAADLPRVARGQAVRTTSAEPGEAPVRLFDEAGRLVAIGRWRGGTLLPDKVLVDAASTGDLPDRPAHEADAHGVGDGPA